MVRGPRAGRDERAPTLLERVHQVAVPVDRDPGTLLEQRDVAPASPDGRRAAARPAGTSARSGRPSRGPPGRRGPRASRRRVGGRQDLDAELVEEGERPEGRASPGARRSGRRAGPRTRPRVARRRRTPRRGRAPASSAWAYPGRACQCVAKVRQISRGSATTPGRSRRAPRGRRAARPGRRACAPGSGRGRRAATPGPPNGSSSREQAGVDVTVHRDDRQARGRGEDLAGDRPHDGVGGQRPVGVQGPPGLAHHRILLSGPAPHRRRRTSSASSMTRGCKRIHRSQPGRRAGHKPRTTHPACRDDTCHPP